MQMSEEELKYREYSYNGALIRELVCETVQVVNIESVSVQDQLDLVMLALSDIYEKIGVS